MAVQLTEKEIARDVTRGGKFLRTLGTRPRIRALLAPRAYTKQEHQRLWALLLVLMGYDPEPAAVETSDENAESLTFIDNADGPLLRAIQVVLEDRYPDQYLYITKGQSPKEGVEAVGVVQYTLDHWAALRDGTDAERGATRDQDKEAADVLALHKVLDASIEADLRKHLKNAQAIAPTVPLAPPSDAQKKYEEAAVEFHISLKKWRELARQTITRRDYQIALGLASRRRSKSAKATTDTDEPDRPMD